VQISNSLLEMKLDTRANKLMTRKDEFPLDGSDYVVVSHPLAGSKCTQRSTWDEKFEVITSTSTFSRSEAGKCTLIERRYLEQGVLIYEIELATENFGRIGPCRRCYHRIGAVGGDFNARSSYDSRSSFDARSSVDVQDSGARDSGARDSDTVDGTAADRPSSIAESLKTENSDAPSVDEGEPAADVDVTADSKAELTSTDAAAAPSPQAPRPQEVAGSESQPAASDSPSLSKKKKWGNRLKAGAGNVAKRSKESASSAKKSKFGRKLSRKKT
jgi:hypothetical protein